MRHPLMLALVRYMLALASGGVLHLVIYPMALDPPSTFTRITALIGALALLWVAMTHGRPKRGPKRARYTDPVQAALLSERTVVDTTLTNVPKGATMSARRIGPL